jgi:ParB-like chromosome segregation protein Spo0J
MRSYREYKEIEIKDIKGCNYIAITVANLDKICLQRDVIRKHGIGKPIEVIEAGNGYRILKGRFKMIAAKTLGYDKIPCLIRDTKQEILLRKINKIFKLEDKNNAIKETINDGKKSYSYDKNSFKLKML